MSVSRNRYEFDVVVVGFADARFGQRVGAVVQLRDDTTCTIDQLQHHARSMSASYKIPRRIAFVDAVTRSASGKPDYQWAALQLATALVADDS